MELTAAQNKNKMDAAEISILLWKQLKYFDFNKFLSIA